MSVQTLPINGKEMSTETTFPVVNPATGETIAGAPLPTIGQIDEAVTAARDAFPAWSSLGHEQRQNLLLECAGELAKHSERIGELLTREQGKPLKEGKREVLQAAHYFKVTAGLSLPEEVIEDSDHRLVKVVHKPLGVVAAIAAWNFPLLLAAFKIAPALLAGNTVVLKPSPETPLSTLEVIRILNGILPAGVLNAVTGKEKEGQHLVTHPLVQKVSFTGSVPVGKIIASQAAPSLKRLTLELGGNDAAIVLPDCDPAKIAKAIFWGGFVNNGQTCIAIKRVYVHDDIHDELVEAVAAIAGSMTYGDGTDPASRLGPLATRAQQRHVAALVEDARAKGGTIHCGGEDPGPDSSGFFYPPTVVSGVAEGCRLVDEEQFGPALPFIRFKDTEDALARANASSFGLGGSVWTADADAGAQLLARMECGSAWLNSHTDFSLEAPFGGAKESGISVENGTDGLKALCQKQTLYLPKK